MRSEWKNIIGQTEEYKGYYNLELKKKTFLNVDGAKCRLDLKKLNVKYRLHITQKDIADTLTNYLLSSLNKDCLNFKETLIDDPEKDYQTHFKFL